MGLNVTSDAAPILVQLDRFLGRDPVGATMFGSIRSALEDGAWAAWTPDGASMAVRSGAALPVVVIGPWPQPQRTELIALLRGLPGLTGLSGGSTLVPPLVAAVHSGPTVRVGQGLYRLDSLTEPAGVTGAASVADAGDLGVLRTWLGEFGAEAGHLPGLQSSRATERALSHGTWWLWRDETGRPVSAARRQPTVAGSARIGPVYTPPPERGHGYGSAVTAAATRDILADAAIPVLFTDLANPTSNAIYQRLGYRLVDERLLVTFG